MIIKTISIRDTLKHHKYNWPITLVKHHLEFNNEKVNFDSLVLLDENNFIKPFQFQNVKMENGYIISGDIFFITDMPCGCNYEYKLCSGEEACVFKLDNECQPVTVQTSVNEVLISNGILCINFPNTQNSVQVNNQDFNSKHIFAISMVDQNAVGYAFIQSDKTVIEYSLTPTAEGSVFCEYIVKIMFSDESVYTATLKIISGMDFIELSEKVKGFGKQDDAKLVIKWKQFDVKTRYTKYRGIEKIDLYNDDYGKLPYTLLPFSGWVSWWDTQAVSFSDDANNISIGLFIRNCAMWDDEEYAIWGSSDTLTVKFNYKTNVPYEQGELSWEYPIADGMRVTAIAMYDSEKGFDLDTENYIDHLWKWYEFINLDKIRGWVLEWDEDIHEYPRFFDDSSIPEDGAELWWMMIHKPAEPILVEEFVYKSSHSMNNVSNISPVGSREMFTWFVIFDMAASKMTKEQFDNLKAAYAFMAHVHMDEGYMPIGNMLSGHPNFLADVHSVPGIMAALFPNHPDAKLWAENYERSTALNLKYHVRPTVESWEAEGGRWTENLGCYNWAALIPTLKPTELLKATTGENPILYPNIVKWAGWMLNTLSAPVMGKRTYPPQGAHAGGHTLDPFIPVFNVRILGEILMNYKPLLAENLLYVSPHDAPGFFEHGGRTDIWRHLLSEELKDNNGTRPLLKSSKYTGYGYVLRSEFNTQREMTVYLQQIDEGPNYRWGRAGEGGNGVVYYYAGEKRYSYNRIEDVGDANMGDVQNSCNFGVLIGHEYKSIGRNDLTEPMYNFDFAQYAQVNAGQYSEPFYKSRSVIMSGNDYIVLYDHVGDMRVRGRFSWFVKDDEEFPSIAQIKPGVKGVGIGPGVPICVSPADVKPATGSKGLQYDGHGDFLTVISHSEDRGTDILRTKATNYGVEVRFKGRTDMVFRDGGVINYNDGNVSFNGLAGIVRIYNNKLAEAALFKGKSIGLCGVIVDVESINAVNSVGISFKVDGREITGKFMSRGDVKVVIRFENDYDTSKSTLYINSDIYKNVLLKHNMIEFIMPTGSHTWQWTCKQPIPSKIEICKTVVSKNAVSIHWNPSSGATYYNVELSHDCGKTWVKIATNICDCNYTVLGFDDGIKVHVRVQPANNDECGEWSCDYPVYFSSKAPVAPEGLRVLSQDNSFKIIWGELLGIDKYRLYRRIKNGLDFELVFEGYTNEYIDTTTQDSNVYEYCVAATNGNGEGERSLIRDTEIGGMAYFDPKPNEGFRRYTKSHEYGFNGFNHWENSKKPILTYPNEI